MEKAYHDCNQREYELTKHISLQRDFPLAFLKLKTTGRCEVGLPEWMFDLDYPGQFMRRIKNVTLTIPCVTGPYTGVHCRLTLLSSTTRIQPLLRERVTGCCDHKEETCSCSCETDEREDLAESYRPLPGDTRIVRSFAATEAIATSTGMNDSGLFELSFRDERYLPFEYAGAISHWRIELPPENNQFDTDTVTDIILHLNYTSREGGERLRRAGSAAASCKLPGDGLRLFDVRHEFPDAWPALRERREQREPDEPWEPRRGHEQHEWPQNRHPGEEHEPREHQRPHEKHERLERYCPGDEHEQWERDRRGEGRKRRACSLNLKFVPAMFPFVPGRRVRWIDGLVLLFAAPDADPGHHHLVRYWQEGDDRDDVKDIECVASDAHPGFYYGVIDLTKRRLGPLTSERGPCCTLEFSGQAGEVCSAHVIARYQAECWPRCGEGPLRCPTCCEEPERERRDNDR